MVDEAPLKKKAAGLEVSRSENARGRNLNGRATAKVCAFKRFQGPRCFKVKFLGLKIATVEIIPSINERSNCRCSEERKSGLLAQFELLTTKLSSSVILNFGPQVRSSSVVIAVIERIGCGGGPANGRRRLPRTATRFPVWQRQV